MSYNNNLLDLAIAAHGGMDTWNKYQTLSTRLSIGGETWKIKKQDGIINNAQYQVSLHYQWASFLEFKTPAFKTIFEQGRVAIETQQREIVEELTNPRSSFANHTIETPWNEMQLIYFASYAMWTYFTAPFNLTLPGCIVKEVKPWIERQETWRRLEVIFPGFIETHSTRQVFYYSEEGLLKRHDYWPDVLGGVPAVQYAWDYKTFDGIRMPTRRKVYPLNSDNSHQPEPVFVSIDMVDASFL